MKYSHVLKYSFAALVLPCLLYGEDLPFGIIGGWKNGKTEAYAALVSSTGVVTPLSPLPTTSISIIESVAINDLGVSIIGGRQIEKAYAALVSRTGVVTHLSPLPTVGISQIRSVAINGSGIGLIGGQQNPDEAYAAIVSPTGAVTPLSPLPTVGASIINVAINDSGTGLIGGLKNTNQAYAARVSSTGVVTDLSLSLPTAAEVSNVAINESGVGLIGGYKNSNDAYAALVSAEGGVTNLSAELPTGGARIFSVAINNSGVGIIGGEHSGSTLAYAAFVSPTGEVRNLSVPLPITSSSIIYGVAINNSGVGLIGGSQNGRNDAFAAFVSPTGVVTPLSHLPTGNHTTIYSVAINDHGAGLIGGWQNDTEAYAALISPTGMVIPLNFPSGINNIFSVALPLLLQIPTAGLTGNNLAFANYINQNASQDAFYFVPSVIEGTLKQALESAAPTRNAISLYTANSNLFYLNHSLSNYLRNGHHFRNRASPTTSQAVALGSTNLKSPHQLLASLADPESNLGVAQEPGPDPEMSSANRPCTVWMDGIGAWGFQKAQKQTVGFDPTTGGLIVGFDAAVGTQSRLGIGAAYSYTHIHENKRAGHSHINQEYLFGYGTYQISGFYIDAALWTGLFQIDQVRKIHMAGFEFQSSSSPKGWQLTPHLELGYEATQDNWLTIDPFVMFDWVNAWQGSYKEHGSGPFNAGQKKHYSSLLRSEIGFRFYETIAFDSWRLVFQEKGSYANKHSFGVGKMNTFLVGSPGFFTVTTLSAPQNLGVVEFGMIFEPLDHRYPYAAINYQAEFSPSFKSHLASLELAWNF